MTTIGDHHLFLRARIMTLAIATTVVSAALLGTAASADTATKPQRDRADHARAEPLVVGHRGASGYRPEHTLAAYELAIRQGADVIEPDLVSTKDGVLIARHENEISTTTDVADRPVFADRRTTKTIDGQAVTGWFTEDFTVAEIKTLRAIERIPDVRPANTVYDGRFEIPTLDEVLALANRHSRWGRTIGVAPETKHPTYFRSIGLAMERPLVRSLQRAHRDHRWSKVIVQSFEIQNLVDLSRMTRVPLLQLTSLPSSAPYDQVVAGSGVTYADMLEPGGLRKISRYADYLGPAKDTVIPVTSDGRLAEPTSLVRDAKRAGLDVVLYTVRAENRYLPPALRSGPDPNALGDMGAEVRAFAAAGVHGIFTDQPDLAVRALHENR